VEKNLHSNPLEWKKTYIEWKKTYIDPS